MIKLLDENTGETYCDHGLGNIFLVQEKKIGQIACSSR